MGHKADEKPKLLFSVYIKDPFRRSSTYACTDSLQILTHTHATWAHTAANTYTTHRPNGFTDTHKTTLLSVGTADKLLSWFLVLFCVTTQES